MTTDQTAWWHVGDFDKVVGLAVTELYQDGRDTLIVDDPLGSLHVVVADTLRNVHFMEIRRQRDEAFELLRKVAEDHIEHDERQNPTTLWMEPKCPDCFLCRLEAFLGMPSTAKQTT